MNTEIVATRKTFDGITVHLHSDGRLSDNFNFIKGGKLPIASMWRVLADLCVYTHAELPALIAEVKAGKWVPSGTAWAKSVPESKRVYREIPLAGSGGSVFIRVS